MSDLSQAFIQGLALTLAAFLWFLMVKMHGGGNLFVKNNHIHVGEGKVEKKKSKYTFNEILSFILIIMIVLLLAVSFISSASHININNASSASIIINERQTSTECKINLNTATKEELMHLPGIGEVKATKIIEYRDQHPFVNVSELLNIIGDQTYNNIKNAVTTEN